MARVTYVKHSRKPLVCGKCGDAIPVGSPYRHASPGFRSQKLVRCTKAECQFRQSDLTTSLLSQVYAAQEAAEEQLAAWDGGIDDVTQILSEVADAAREVADEYRTAADAMGDAGEQHNERADELESYADELENWTFSGDEEPPSEAEQPVCDECGERVVADESPGVWHHVSETEPTGIDHDADEDHVPVVSDDDWRDNVISEAQDAMSELQL